MYASWASAESFSWSNESAFGFKVPRKVAATDSPAHATLLPLRLIRRVDSGLAISESTKTILGSTTCLISKTSPFIEQGRLGLGHCL